MASMTAPVVRGARPVGPLSTWSQDLSPAPRRESGTRPPCHPPRRGAIDDLPSPAPPRPQSPLPPGPPDIGTDPPLRAGPTGRIDPRRREEARPHPPRRRPQGPRAGRPPGRTSAEEWATPISTPPSTTTAAWPTPRSSPTNRAPPRRRSGAEPRRGSLPEAWSSNGCSPTTTSPTEVGSSTNQALAEYRILHKYCRPYRPQTNGKVERFHRTLLEEWAYVRPYACEAVRTRALARWLHRYNHHRVHTAIGGPPISRVTNVPREHS